MRLEEAFERVQVDHTGALSVVALSVLLEVDGAFLEFDTDSSQRYDDLLFFLLGEHVGRVEVLVLFIRRSFVFLRVLDLGVA